MQKEALVGGLINTAIIGEGVIKGGKKFKQEIKNPSVSSHDVILNNKAPELPSEKVIPDAKAASIIDSIYLEKLAEDEEEKYKAGNKGPGSFVPKGVGALLLGTYIASALSHGGNFVEPLRQAGRGVQEVPRIIANKLLKRNRFGKVVAEVLKKGKEEANKASGVAGAAGRARGGRVPTGGIDEKSWGDKALTGMVLGGSLATGNLGIHILGDKYFDNKKAVRKSYDSFPEMTDVYHNVMNKKEKKASDFIDEAFEKTAMRFASGKHFAKKLLKEDIAQNAIGSLPFFALPAAASYVTGRDLRYDAKKIDKKGKDKITIDIPLSDFKKTAGVKGRMYKGVVDKMRARAAKEGLHKTPSWKEFFKYEMPARAVRALSWVAPATALTAITGRNIRGSMERTDSQNNKPLEPGKARITIETASHKGHNEADPRYASDRIDGLYKVAIAVRVSDNSSVKKNEIKA